ncbi:MAG: hypothetical protein H6617_06510 [Bdellovibrionaceae bacterium]|nr:hypothetical protein [Pseudobdellovibrionaceae bacterium]
MARLKPIMGSERTGILLVIEGWGHAPEDRYNAVSQARTPNLDRLFGEYPHFLLEASGKATGLPEGVPSTSEAGYLTLGAGRPLAHARSLIQDAIQSGSFSKTPLARYLQTHAPTAAGNVAPDWVVFRCRCPQ